MIAVGGFSIFYAILKPSHIPSQLFCEDVDSGIKVISGRENLPLNDLNYEPISITNIQDLRQIAVAEIPGVVAYSGQVFGFSPASEVIASSNFAQTNYAPSTYTLLWYISSEQPCFRRFRQRDLEEMFVSFNSAGDLLLTASRSWCPSESCYYIRDLQTGLQIASFSFAEFMTFPDGDKLSYSLPNDNRIYLWDLRGNVDENSVEVPGKHIRAYSINHEKYVVQNIDGSISVWDDQSLNSLTQIHGSFSRIFQPFFSPDGNWLILRLFQKDKSA